MPLTRIASHLLKENKGKYRAGVQMGNPPWPWRPWGACSVLEPNYNCCITRTGDKRCPLILQKK
jgi:hypothetical protein